MNEYIDLKRSFRDLTDEEPEDRDLLSHLDESGLGSSLGWSDLLKHSRVILLAEGGSGKTWELREQAKRLGGEKKYAFFVALEDLDENRLRKCLCRDEKQVFKEWKAEGREPAWFFLDALDELKLVGRGQFDRALRNLARDIDSELRRARVVISCRPSDWRHSLDLRTVIKRLPVSPPEELSRTSEEAFMAPLKREEGQSVASEEDAEELTDDETVQTLKMVPMNADQVKLFVTKSELTDPESFLSKLEEEDAWEFARRPLDLMELIGIWRRTGHLGTRAEQHEVNVEAKLKEGPHRPDGDILQDSQARAGAERLALGLALTRTRSIQTPDLPVESGFEDHALDAKKILRDGWSEAKRGALLRSALFDPGTYGRIRFHHRSAEEYLAACHLRRLRSRGMSQAALHRFLFAEPYGTKVMLPSMRGIAAWVALEEESVRSEIIKREPEVLIEHGDSGSLSVDVRRKLVRTLVAKYGKGGWTGLRFAFEDMRRFAHQELESVIRECWESEPENEEIRVFLIGLIWHGRIDECRDIARAVAFDSREEELIRIVAIKALHKFENQEVLREIADAMLESTDAWPDSVIQGTVTDLFPKVFSTEEVVTLVKRTPESKQTSYDFEWALKQIAESITPWSAQTVELRDAMATLIATHQVRIEPPFHFQSKFDHLVPALATLCARQLATGPASLCRNLLRGCIIASRFGTDNSGKHEPVAKVKEHFAVIEDRRSEGYWEELAFMDEMSPCDSDGWRVHLAEQENIVGHLEQRDRKWLLAALADRESPDRRRIALRGLLGLWLQRGGIRSELEEIEKRLGGDKTLVQIYEEWTKPTEQDKKSQALRDKHEKRLRERGRLEKREIEVWRKWRRELQACPADAFTAERESETHSRLYSWLRKRKKSFSHENVWDRNALKEAFGEEVADFAQRSLQRLWRRSRPMLWSERSIGERNTIRLDWALGLMGLAAESSMQNWRGTLSLDEAHTAAAYATIEIGGFSAVSHGIGGRTSQSSSGSDW